MPRRSDGLCVENHYCSVCLATQRFLATEKTVQVAQYTYLILLCEVCCKDLWRLVSENGSPVVQEVSDA